MIQTDISSITYAGNASSLTPYPVPFLFFTEEDLVVVVKDVSGFEETQFLGTDYTVLGEGDPNGGSITMTWAVPVDSSVTISRVIAATQLTSYEEADAFPAKSHERALDKLTMLVQQSLRLTGGGPTDVGRAFRLTDASAGINAVSKVTNSVLGIDAFGNALLRTAGETIDWLGTLGTAWENTEERLATLPAFVGQVGFQRDIATIFYSVAMSPGAWNPYFPGEGIVVSSAEGEPSIILRPAGDVVGTDESQTLLNKTLVAPSIVDPTGLDKSDVGLSNVDNVADSQKPVSAPQAAAMGNLQARSEKGVAGGYASLDNSIKIPLAQIPDAVVGASQYQGTWNAATNTPAIPTAAVGNKGWYYAVAVAGTTNINGISSWAVGDQIISNGSVWQKIVNVSAVSSVNAKTGAVVLVPADLNLGNVDNTSDATKNSAAVTLTNHTINGANNTLTVRLANDVSGNLPVARLNAGTGASATTWWCGDGTWKQPIGAGDVVGPAVAIDGEIAVYSGTTGKLLGRLARNLVGDLYGPASAANDHLVQFNGTTGKLVKDGRIAPAGEIVGTTDTQTLSNKTINAPNINTLGALYRPGGVVAANTVATATGTLGVGEWDHIVYTVPAGMLSKDGDEIRIEMIGLTLAGSAIGRGFRVRQAGAVVFVIQSLATSQTYHWLHFHMWRSGAGVTSKWAHGRTNDAGGANAEYNTINPVDFGATIELKLSVFTTGGGAHATIPSASFSFLPVP